MNNCGGSDIRFRPEGLEVLSQYGSVGRITKDVDGEMCFSPYNNTGIVLQAADMRVIARKLDELNGD